MNALGGIRDTIDPMITPQPKVLTISGLRILQDEPARKAAMDEIKERTGGGVGGTHWIAPLCDYEPPIHFRWPEYITTPRSHDWWIRANMPCT